MKVRLLVGSPRITERMTCEHKPEGSQFWASNQEPLWCEGESVEVILLMDGSEGRNE